MAEPLEKLPAKVAQDMAAQEEGTRHGELTLYTCPECGGSLWQADDTGLLQVLIERHLRAPVRRPLPILLDDKAFDMDPRRFGILLVDADIADLRIGHADQLSFVRRVRENFLVAAHGSVEHDLAHSLANGAESAADKDAAIRERENCLR